MHYVVKEISTCAPQKEDIPATAPGEKEPKNLALVG